MVWVQPLAWECPRAVGVAKKKKAMKVALHTLESIIKKTSVGKDVEKREPLETDGGNINWHYGK